MSGKKKQEKKILNKNVGTAFITFASVVAQSSTNPSFGSSSESETGRSDIPSIKSDLGLVPVYMGSDSDLGMVSKKLLKKDSVSW